MIAFGTQAHGAHRRRAIAVDDSTFYKGEWMETGENPRLSPTVFLAEQPPDYNLMAHFHRQNQFQLFVEGTAALGREPIEPITVHYAGAHTGYGPLLSGPHGIKYFTIRPVFDTGLIPASEARQKMIRGPKRHAQTTLGAAWTEQRLRELADPLDVFAIAPERGLAVRHLRLPPAVRWPIAHVEGCAGVFVFVLAGSAQAVSRTLGKWESVFATPDETLTVNAGGAGAELVAMYVPPTESVYAAQG